VCNIWYQKCCIEIQSGAEQVCPKCKGHGGFLRGASFRSGKYSVHQCLQCKGEGKVDWISALHDRTYLLTPMQRLARENIKKVNIKCPARAGCKKIKRMWKQRKHKSLGGYNCFE